MTIEELQEMLERIPGDTAMNKASRRTIIEMIYRIMEKEETNE